MADRVSRMARTGEACRAVGRAVHTDPMATRDPAGALDKLAAATRMRAQAAQELELAHEAWRRALLGAVDEGATVVAAAQAGGVSRRRFYQVQGEARPELSAAG